MLPWPAAPPSDEGTFFVLELSHVTYAYELGEGGSGENEKPQGDAQAGAAAPAPVVHDVSLSVAPGELVALVGANGAGKSTLGKLLCGTLLPQQGFVLLEGERASARELHGAVGYVRQDPESQLVAPDVFEEVAFGPCNLGLPEHEVRSRVSEVLVRCGLAGFEGRLVSELSGGEKQRLALAGVLALRPRYLVLDEVTSQLDAASREAVLAIIDELVEDGVGVISITHYADEVARATRVVRVGAERLPAEDPSALGVASVPSDAVRPGSLREEQPVPVPVPAPGAAPVAPVAAQGRDLALDGVTVAYEGRTVLERVSLRCPAGTLTMLEGASGVGKSTLARVACGLSEPSEGHACVGGEPVAPGRVALCLQRCEDQLFCNSVLEDVCVGPRNLGAAADEARERAERALRALGVGEELWERSPFALSGGQRRRVALAGIVAMEPWAYVLDEPSVGLDAEGAEQLFDLVAALVRTGYPVLLVTHDPFWLQRLGEADARDIPRARWRLQGGSLVPVGACEQVGGDKGASASFGLGSAGPGSCGGAASVSGAAARKEPRLDPPPRANTAQSGSRLHENAAQSGSRPRPSAARTLPFGGYTNRNTPLHRLDARVKIALLLACTIALFAASSPVAIAGLALMVCACARVAGMGAKDLVRGLKPAAVILVFSLVSNALVADGTGDVALVGMLGLRWAGALRGALVVVRIAVLVAASLVLTTTTSSTAVADALASVLAPLERLGMPAGDLAMTVSVALRFIPLTAEELERIRDAQRARGVDFASGGVVARVGRWLSVLTPLVVALLRRADDLAAAMAERCYRGRGRTRLVRSLGRTDVAVLLVGLMVCALACLL